MRCRACLGEWDGIRCACGWTEEHEAHAEIRDTVSRWQTFDRASVATAVRNNILHRRARQRGSER